jgi:hypothetical protein
MSADGTAGKFVLRQLDSVARLDYLLKEIEPRVRGSQTPPTKTDWKKERKRMARRQR